LAFLTFAFKNQPAILYGFSEALVRPQEILEKASRGFMVFCFNIITIFIYIPQAMSWVSESIPHFWQATLPPKLVSIIGPSNWCPQSRT